MEYIKSKEFIEFPYDIITIDSDTNKQLLNDFNGAKYGNILVGPEKYIYPSAYRHLANNFYNFEALSDDIWVISFPRSGTTITQELVWMIRNNLDFETANKIKLMERFPFYESPMFINSNTAKKIEYTMYQNFYDKLDMTQFELLAKMKSQRFIKTHFPFSLLPPSITKNNSKIVYVARNPKDVAVSYYYFSRLFKPIGFTGNFTTFWDYFEKNLCIWMPYWAHIKEAWTHRNDSNILFLFYENIVKDFPKEIRRVATFLNKSLTEDQIISLADYLHFDNFRKNDSVNFSGLDKMGVFNRGESEFIRKGKIGGWREEFTPELNEKADRWIESNLKDTDLKFPPH